MFPVDIVSSRTSRPGASPPSPGSRHGSSSEHPEYSFCHGENWSTEVINAIMNSPMWEDTAIFLTWDDYGGFYDHVPPPQVDGFGFGIRPDDRAQPVRPAGAVSHELGEFSSVLRFIEDNWARGAHPSRPACHADAVRVRLLAAAATAGPVAGTR